MRVYWLRIRGDENNYHDSFIPGGELSFDRIHHKYLDRHIGIEGLVLGRMILSRSILYMCGASLI